MHWIIIIIIVIEKNKIIFENNFFGILTPDVIGGTWIVVKFIYISYVIQN